MVGFFSRIADALTIWFAGFLSLEIRQRVDWPQSLQSNSTDYPTLIFLAGLIFILLQGEIYRSWRGSNILEMMFQVLWRWVSVIAILLLWMFVFKTSHEVSRIWFATYMLTGAVGLILERAMIHTFLRILRRRGFNDRRVALVGRGQNAQALKQRVLESGWTGYKIVCHITSNDVSDLQALECERLDEIWLAMPLHEESYIRKVLYALRHSTVIIRFSPDLFTLRLINHGISEVAGIPMYDLFASTLSGTNSLIKLIEDRLLAFAILLFISPLMVVIALAVRVTSPGPIFFVQDRLGEGGRTIRVLKFRSMYVHHEPNGGVTQASKGDKRITRLGALLRRTSLDELPQFFNVLRGEMSIVGPRPHALQHNDLYKDLVDDYMFRHLVKPGITGWAQVNGFRGETDTLEKMQRRVEYDLFYIENWSPWFDLKIMLLTVIIGFKDSNAY